MIYDIFAYSFAAIAVACIAAAWLRRSKRVTFIWAAGSAAIAAGSAFLDNFWPVPVFALMTLWALFSALDTMTSAWRIKAGFSLALAIGAGVAIYPTVHDELLCSGPPEEIPGTCPSKLAELDPATVADFSTEAAAGNKGFSNWLLHNMGFRMVRGLDLKGGLRLVYTVDVAEAIRDRRDRYHDDLQVALTKAYGFSTSDEPTREEMQKLAEKVELRKPRGEVDTIEMVFKNPAELDQYLTGELLATFRGELTLVRGDAGAAELHIKNSVESALREKAVAQAKEIVGNRIDALGVKEASVSTRDEDIIIEIPGESEKDFKEIRDIISQTARLEFKMLDDAGAYEFFEPFVDNADVPEGMTFLVENAPIGPQGSEPAYYARIDALPGETLESARKRFEEWIATLPVDQYHEIGIEKVVAFDEETEEYAPVGWRTYYLFSKAELTGDMVRDAVAQIDQSDTGMGQWHVSMTLDRRGARIFEEVTEKNVKRRFAIILDGVVESAPQIREKIGGGSARISMGAGGVEEQYQEAKALELVLRSGALPAPISPSNEQRIGPSLGHDSIAQGVTAAGLGGVIVIVLIFAFYKRAGTIANVAVLFNLFLQLTVLSMFSASMTLPGLAGLALTVGMAVDANVLINERIREELAQGKTARAAVTAGYDRAFSAIIDGNATTLIAGLILMQFGTGPIKGFAVALIVGMACNLFTGVTVTRLIFEFWVRGRRNVTLSI